MVFPAGSAKSQVLTADSLVARVSLDILQTHIQTLASGGGTGSRVTFTPGMDSAANYILRAFQAMPGLDTVAPDTFYVPLATAPYNTQPLRNIVATITGTTEPEKQIVIGAHYDCSASRMGSTTWNAQWNTIAAPGADDNATGVATVLELARILSDPEHGVVPAYTIIFVAFGAEESVPPYAGKISHPGSKHYAGQAASRGDQIMGMISVDMIGYNPTVRYLSIVANETSQSLGASVASANYAYGLGLVTNPAPYASATFSDHNEFWTYGYPAICLIEHNPPWNSSAYYTANPYYHTTADSFGTLNMTLVQKVAQATLGAVIAEAGVVVTGAAEDDADVPETFVLEQNFPNPFNPGTVISFRSPITSHLSLKIYDVLGREVAVLVNQAMASGEHRVTWNAEHRPSGMYFYALEATSPNGNTLTRTKKMVLIR